MRFLSVSVVFAILISGRMYGQSKRACATMEVDRMLRMEHPGYEQEREAIERFTQEWIAQNPAGLRTQITIPVVFHVVYNTTAENLSDAQLLSQLDVLNEDLRKLNADVASARAAFLAVAADCEINFCLAQRDPNGNPTNGIVRVYTTKTSFSSNNDVKYTSKGGSDAWDRNSYLNIWVCDLSGGLLGYAQFPGGPAATDGIVIDYAYTGRGGSATPPYHLGRTATHEVGHWLNLYHIWGDDGISCNGSDLVADTPNQADETYGCPLPTIRISCSNGPDGDMYENYMDYTDDACMVMFTEGQKARMQAVLAPGGARHSLWSSMGCVPVSGSTCATPTSLTASSITSTSAVIDWSVVSGAVSYNLEYKPASSSTWVVIGTTTNSYTLTGLSASTTYDCRVQALCESQASNYSSIMQFTTLSDDNCTDGFESNNSKNTAADILTGTDYSALINPAGDLDWYQFSNTSAQKNIQVLLTSLPANYDVRLYNPSGTLVASSKNSGTNNETINYNTTVVGTYKIRVNGVNNAFHATDCYDLRVNLSSSNFRGEEGMFIEPAVVLSPNPSYDRAVLTISSYEDQTLSIRILDLLGRLVHETSVTVKPGIHELPIEVASFMPGQYLVEVQSANWFWHTRFIVLR